MNYLLKGCSQLLAFRIGSQAMTVRGRVKPGNVAEVVAIGNELLIGHTLDTNSHWIAKQLNRFGWKLQRATTLRDSLVEISEGLREAVKRGPDLIITVGGLGPTNDDMTLKGLGLAIKRPLVPNQKALEAIKRRYERMDEPATLTKYRRKMATLPSGSKPLPNPVGTAPGVLTQHGRTTILSLPGVPREMKAIFKGSIIPVLQRVSSEKPQEATIRLVGVIESALAPVLESTQRNFPGLYFKSHPRGRETGVRSLIEVHIYKVEGKSGGAIADAIVYLLTNLAA
jgi:molybdenum cofactor synthesis domain-containing protein